MDISLNLDLIDFHTPRDDRIFKDSSDRWGLFRDVRFKHAGDGEYAVIRQLNLSGRNFNDFTADHIAFVQCNLDNVSFRNTHFAFETAFINCSMKNVDFTNTLCADALFINCDLTGLKISPLRPYTQWVSEDLDGKDIPSTFDGCKLDDQTKQFLIENKCLVDGVKLTEKQHLDVTGNVNDKLYRIITAPILDL